MDQYDFIKLFSAMLLETENPYFRKKDLGRFLYEHYDDPEYNSILSSFAILSSVSTGSFFVRFVR